MASSLIVPVAVVDQVFPHPNADQLEIVHVLGWQIVAQKGSRTVGEKVVYFPPDVLLPEAVSDKFGVTKYLSKGRTRSIKLRGEASYGFIVEPENPDWPLGFNAAEHYGVQKYEPPLRPAAEDVEKEHARFVRYTDIQNLRNYPHLFHEGEEVLCTEKVHGTNCRVGWVEGEFMAGSMGYRRKMPETEAKRRNSLYWFPLQHEPVKNLLTELAGQGHKQIVLYGEVYGSKVQSFDYGHQGKLGFAAFDLLIDDQFADYEKFYALCQKHGVASVPVLYRGPYSLETIKALSFGATKLQGEHIREGLVVKPIQERWEPALNSRLILKYISDDYLCGKKSDYKDI